MIKNLKHQNAKSDYNHRTPEKDNGQMEQLVAGCIEGDRRCQLALLRKYRESVYSLIFRLLGPGHDIDEVMQQVFIKFFQSLPNFKGLSSLDTWVYRITAKVCTDQLRKKYRKRQVAVLDNSHEIAENAESGWHSTPAANIERREMVQQIYQALEKLSADKRTVLVMFEMEERSMEEIADILNKPLGTIKSRLFHARREMEKHLGRYLGR